MVHRFLDYLLWDWLTYPLTSLLSIYVLWRLIVIANNALMLLGLRYITVRATWSGRGLYIGRVGKNGAYIGVDGVRHGSGKNADIVYFSRLIIAIHAAATGLQSGVPRHAWLRWHGPFWSPHAVNDDSRESDT